MFGGRKGVFLLVKEKRQRTNLTLITIGGQVNPFVGAAGDGGRALRFWSFAQIFSCWEYAIDADDGLAAFHSEDAQMKCTLLERSGSVAVAVPNEKFSAPAPFQVGAVDVVADLFVEADAPKRAVLGFESRGVRIHRTKL
jgi:DeoR/GlpR family transcriptional regulator of sugar metabolism